MSIIFMEPGSTFIGAILDSETGTEDGGEAHRITLNQNEPDRYDDKGWSNKNLVLHRQGRRSAQASHTAFGLQPYSHT